MRMAVRTNFGSKSNACAAIFGFFLPARPLSFASLIAAPFFFKRYQYHFHESLARFLDNSTESSAIGRDIVIR